MEGKRICQVCGGAVESGSQVLCYGCWLDGLVPAGYERCEAYHWDPQERVFRAAGHPATGVAALDMASPPRICESAPMLSATQILAMAARERSVGLNDDFDEILAERRKKFLSPS